MRIELIFFTLFLFSLCFAAEPSIPRACSGNKAHFPFCNPSLPLDQRIGDLISRLTLEEKPYLLVARESPKGSIPRLGIPEFDWGGNCVHGVQSRCITPKKDPQSPHPENTPPKCPTSFPSPNSLGNSFNTSSWRAMGGVIGREIRAVWLQGGGEDHASNLPHIAPVCWSPNINIVRDARWGRNMETPSEDPLVCGMYGAMYSDGLQRGEDPRYLQAVTTIKHFDANSLEGCWGDNCTITRHSFDAKISRHDMRSSYLPAFKLAVQLGNAMGVMCSYNSINSIPSCANPALLLSLLREEWGFDGYIVSDTGAINDIHDAHHFAKDWKETVAKAIRAGTNIESAGWQGDHAYATGGLYISYIAQAIKAGLLNESDVDGAVYRALSIRFQLGLFDPIDDQPYWHVSPDVIGSQEHQDLSKSMTDESIVMLRNENNTLPFSPKSKVALIGPHVFSKLPLFGNYIGQICPASMTDDSCIPSIFDEFDKLVKEGGGELVATQGCNINSDLSHGVDEAVSLAASADVIVLVMGIDGSLEGEGNDRHSISLPLPQQNLIFALSSLQKPLTLILIHGGVIDLTPFPPKFAPSILSAGYLGLFSGVSLAEKVFGKNNRFGKTAVTWWGGGYEEKFDFLNFNMTDFPGRTYRYYREGEGGGEGEEKCGKAIMIILITIIMIIQV